MPVRANSNKKNHPKRYIKNKKIIFFLYIYPFAVCRLWFLCAVGIFAVRACRCFWLVLAVLFFISYATPVNFFICHVTSFHFLAIPAIPAILTEPPAGVSVSRATNCTQNRPIFALIGVCHGSVLGLACLFLLSTYSHLFKDKFKNTPLKVC